MGFVTYIPKALLAVGGRLVTGSARIVGKTAFYGGLVGTAGFGLADIGEHPGVGFKEHAFNGAKETGKWTLAGAQVIAPETTQSAQEAVANPKAALASSWDWTKATAASAGTSAWEWSKATAVSAGNSALAWTKETVSGTANAAPTATTPPANPKLPTPETIKATEGKTLPPAPLPPAPPVPGTTPQAGAGSPPAAAPQATPPATKPADAKPQTPAVTEADKNKTAPASAQSEHDKKIENQKRYAREQIRDDILCRLENGSQARSDAITIPRDSIGTAGNYQIVKSGTGSFIIIDSSNGHRKSIPPEALKNAAENYVEQKEAAFGKLFDPSVPDVGVQQRDYFRGKRGTSLDRSREAVNAAQNYPDHRIDATQFMQQRRQQTADNNDRYDRWVAQHPGHYRSNLTQAPQAGDGNQGGAPSIDYSKTGYGTPYRTADMAPKIQDLKQDDFRKQVNGEGKNDINSTFQPKFTA